MNNGISDRQNTPDNLQLLAAQRVFYVKAKRLAAIQAWLAAMVPIVAAAMTAFCPKTAGWAAILGIGTALADTWFLDPKQSEWRKWGANTKEKFDCAVLVIAHNEALEGSCPTPEDIFEAEQEYRPNPKVPLPDWYPKKATELPLALGRLVCQRTNLWWDSKLRRRYRGRVAIILVIITAASFLFGFAKHWSLEQFVLAVLAPLFPALMWAGREYRRQTDGAAELDRLRDTTERLWNHMLQSGVSEAEIESSARPLQDAILVSRRERATVFDWIYRRLREKQEDQMNVGAEKMIQEIRARRPELL
jgi:hypothetical protein